MHSGLNLASKIQKCGTLLYQRCKVCLCRVQCEYQTWNHEDLRTLVPNSWHGIGKHFNHDACMLHRLWQTFRAKTHTATLNNLLHSWGCTHLVQIFDGQLGSTSSWQNRLPQGNGTLRDMFATFSTSIASPKDFHPYPHYLLASADRGVDGLSIKRGAVDRAPWLDPPPPKGGQLTPPP